MALGTLDFMVNVKNLNGISKEIGESLSSAFFQGNKAWAKDFLKTSQKLAKSLEGDMRLGLGEDIIKAQGDIAEAREMQLKNIEAYAKYSGAIVGNFNRYKESLAHSLKLFQAQHKVLGSMINGAKKLVGFAKNLIPSQIKQLMGLGLLVALYSTLKSKILEIDSLYEKTGKTVARFANSSSEVVRIQRSFIDAAIQMKSEMPLAELENLTNLMGEFALEGITSTKVLKKVVKPMEAFAFFNGEAAEALVPLISSIVKTSGKLPNLSKALGYVSAGFGKFAGQALSALSKLSRFTSNGDFEKLTKGASAFARGLKGISLTGGEIQEFITSLSNPDIRQIPTIFQPFMKQRSLGNFDGIIGKLRDLQVMAKKTSDFRIAQLAENFGVTPELLISLKKTKGNIVDIMHAAEKANKKTPGITDQFNNATQSFMQKFKAQFELIGNQINKMAVRILPKLKSAFDRIAGGKNGINSLGDKIAAFFDNITQAKIDDFVRPIQGAFSKMGKVIEYLISDKFANSMASMQTTFTTIWNAMKATLSAMPAITAALTTYMTYKGISKAAGAGQSLMNVLGERKGGMRIANFAGTDLKGKAGLAKGALGIAAAAAIGYSIGKYINDELGLGKFIQSFGWDKKDHPDEVEKRRRASLNKSISDNADTLMKTWADSQAPQMAALLKDLQDKKIDKEENRKFMKTLIEINNNQLIAMFGVERANIIIAKKALVK